MEKKTLEVERQHMKEDYSIAISGCMPEVSIKKGGYLLLTGYSLFIHIHTHTVQVSISLHWNQRNSATSLVP